MRDVAFTLTPALTPPEPPFGHAPLPRPPWIWIVSDGLGREVATAPTRAGARAAVRALYSRLQIAA
ncbi:MAG TPA: hypothetical protein VGH15_05770 [Caulobacteraceae bacterium]|jgi:hypothetical protein